MVVEEVTQAAAAVGMEEEEENGIRKTGVVEEVAAVEELAVFVVEEKDAMEISKIGPLVAPAVSVVVVAAVDVIVVVAVVQATSIEIVDEKKVTPKEEALGKRETSGLQQRAEDRWRDRFPTKPSRPKRKTEKQVVRLGDLLLIEVEIPLNKKRHIARPVNAIGSL